MYIKELKNEVMKFYWQASSRYDEAVLESVFDDIHDNASICGKHVCLEGSDDISVKDFAAKLMYNTMVRMGHL
tara:strand:- start:181 stop:399 length:219 start_codon:yes stop_codon:yes gene_type:complete